MRQIRWSGKREFMWRYVLSYRSGKEIDKVDDGGKDFKLERFGNGSLEEKS